MGTEAFLLSTEVRPEGGSGREDSDQWGVNVSHIVTLHSWYLHSE